MSEEAFTELGFETCSDISRRQVVDIPDGKVAAIFKLCRVHFHVVVRHGDVYFFHHRKSHLFNEEL